MYSLDGVWANASDDEANIEWSRKGWDNAAEFGHESRIYLSFPGHGEDGAALTEAAFGPNYRRLAKIKTKYDPTNVFRLHQNITSGDDRGGKGGVSTCRSR